MRRGMTVAGAVAVLAAMAPAAGAEAPRVLHRATVGGPVTLPPTACAGALEGLKSDAAPLIGAVPGKPDELRAVYQAHGERLQVAASSSDGGRSWRRAAIPSATQCLGGPSERNMSVNPLFDVGAGGAAYFGESWFNSPSEDFDEWRYGVTLHHRPGAAAAFDPDVAPPTGDVSSQNLAVAAHRSDPSRVSAIWTHIDQIPNPITYTPLPNELRFSQSSDGGRTWAEQVVVHEAPAPELVINPRMVRLDDGSLVAIFDRASLADFPAAQLGIADAPTKIFAMRSADGVGWSEPVRIGTGYMSRAVDPDGGDGFVVEVKPDLAAGPGGEVVVSWPHAGATTVRIARSHDGGRTWDDPQDTVSLPRQPFNTAVALDGEGRPGVFYYDLRHDVRGDDEFTVQPRFAALTKSGWRDVALEPPFDLNATANCEKGLDPTGFTWSCRPGSHAGALGVYQDVEGLPKGFGVGYTVGPPLARDGFTDARYARIAVKR